MAQTRKLYLRRMIRLAIIVNGLGVILAGVSVYFHYSFERESRIRQEQALVLGHAKFLESIERLDRDYHVLHGLGEAEDCGLVREVIERYYRAKGFGGSGDIILGQNENSELRLTRFSARHEIANGQSIRGSGTPWEEPMAKALAGQVGHMPIRDDSGHQVLACYQPVKGSSWGIVAVVDLAVVREPFVMTAIGLGGATMIAVLLAVFLFHRTVEPVLRELTASEEKYRKVAEMSVAGISIHDPSLCFTFANPALERMLGYEPGQLVGVHLSEVSTAIQAGETANQAGKLPENTRRRILGEGPTRYEVDLIRKDGSELPVMISSSALLDKAHRFQGTLAIVVDVSEQKATEAELIRLKEAAESASSVKSEFLANISHELRSPLHVILGFAHQGLRRLDKLDRDRLESYFKHIVASGTVLLHTVNELLDLSRLDARRMPFEFQPVDLGRLIDTVVDECESLFSQRGIHVLFCKPPAPVIAEVDPQRIMQVLRNLLANAAKFAESKTSAEVVLVATDDMARFEVRDHGPGIPPEDLESIFLTFHQSSRTRSGAGGTGLGLAICREIVNAHNGRIWAENRDFSGAVFICEMPLHRGVEETCLSGGLASAMD